MGGSGSLLIKEAIKCIIKLIARGGRIDMGEAAVNCRLNVKFLESVVKALEDRGLLKAEGGIVETEDFWELLFWTLDTYNIDLEDMLGDLDWRFFEKLVDAVFERMGYKVLRNYRFKHGKRVFEIDILAWREGEMLVIECKRWRRAGISRVRKASKYNFEKAEKLASIASDNLRFKGEVYSVVLTLRDEPVRFLEGSAVVPIFRLRDFLLEFSTYKSFLNPIIT